MCQEIAYPHIRGRCAGGNIPHYNGILSPFSPAIYFYSLMLDNHFVGVAKQCSTEHCERLSPLIKPQDAKHIQREDFFNVCVHVIWDCMCAER